MEGPTWQSKKRRKQRPTSPEGGGDGRPASPEIAKKGKRSRRTSSKLLDEMTTSSRNAKSS